MTKKFVLSKVRNTVTIIRLVFKWVILSKNNNDYDHHCEAIGSNLSYQYDTEAIQIKIIKLTKTPKK